MDSLSKDREIFRIWFIKIQIVSCERALFLRKECLVWFCFRFLSLCGYRAPLVATLKTTESLREASRFQNMPASFHQYSASGKVKSERKNTLTLLSCVTAPGRYCEVVKSVQLKSDKQVRIPSWPLNCGLGKLLSFSVPQFAHLQNGDDSCPRSEGSYEN